MVMGKVNGIKGTVGEIKEKVMMVIIMVKVIFLLSKSNQFQVKDNISLIIKNCKIFLKPGWRCCSNWSWSERRVRDEKEENKIKKKKENRKRGKKKKKKTEKEKKKKKKNTSIAWKERKASSTRITRSQRLLFCQNFFLQNCQKIYLRISNDFNIPARRVEMKVQPSIW